MGEFGSNARVPIHSYPWWRLSSRGLCFGRNDRLRLGYRLDSSAPSKPTPPPVPKQTIDALGPHGPTGYSQTTPKNRAQPPDRLLHKRRYAPQGFNSRARRVCPTSTRSSKKSSSNRLRKISEGRIEREESHDPSRSHSREPAGRRILT